jgi:chitodextrinase
MINSFTKVTSFGLLILSFVSCSKNDPAPPIVTPVKNCKIIAASEVSGTGANIAKYSFTYNSDGKLAGSLYEGSYNDTISYTYNGNTIYRSVAAGINSSVDTITLNDAGLEVHNKEVIGTSVYMTDYVYDANMQLKTFTQQQDSYPPISASYTFTNGDNTLITNGAYQDTLVYDINKPAVQGNLDQFNQLLYMGAMYIKNKHLLISDNHGASIKYSYEFNADGNISSVKISVGNNSETISYTYDCK